MYGTVNCSKKALAEPKDNVNSTDFFGLCKV